MNSSFRRFLYSITTLIFLMINFGLVGLASAKGLPPEVRFCRAAGDATGDDGSLHYFSTNGIPFCQYGAGVIGYEALFNRVENNVVTLAQQSYWSNVDCDTDSSTCFVCKVEDGCRLGSGRVTDDQGAVLGEFSYYIFSDGSVIGQSTLDVGPMNEQNSQLNRALSKYKIDY